MTGIPTATVAELNEEYITKMEDVLETYEKPYVSSRTGGLLGRKAGYPARRCSPHLPRQARAGSAAG